MNAHMTVADKSDGTITIEVMLAMPLVQYRQELHVPAGITARDAVKLALECGLLPLGADIDINPVSAPLGVFAEKVEEDYPCRDGDRVEIYRPLQQDPMELRRQRARQSIS